MNIILNYSLDELIFLINFKSAKIEIVSILSKLRLSDFSLKNLKTSFNSDFIIDFSYTEIETCDNLRASKIAITSVSISAKFYECAKTRRRCVIASRQCVLLYANEYLHVYKPPNNKNIHIKTSIVHKSVTDILAARLSSIIPRRTRVRLSP